ncbi:MAG: hypothetical protein ACI8WB_003967 [Phenylobacterium sp.]|jgi:hypothetical protein
MSIKSPLTAVLLLLTLSFPALSYQQDAFARPIVYGNFVKDMPTLLKQAVNRNGWTLTQDDKGQFFAHIAYKTYEINMQIVVSNNEIRIQRQSVTRPECKNRCSINEDKVQGWLLRLRKTIGYELTQLAREDARNNMGAKN